MDLVVTNGIVLTMNEEMKLLDHGWIAVNNGCIVEIESHGTRLPPNADRVIDARGGIIMPGLVNCHTHAAMTLVRGLALDLPPMEWLKNHAFSAPQKTDPQSLYKGALLACGEMILSGTTCFSDTYMFEHGVARAAEQSGIRAVVGETLWDFPGSGDMNARFARAEKLLEQWKDNPLVKGAVAPYSACTCTPQELRRAAELAGRHGVPLIIHLAERKNELSMIKEKHGKSPAELLESLGILGPGLVACHSIHLTKSDMELYRKYDVKVAHCPGSDMKLASGVAPIPELLKLGVTVGLATDSVAGNNTLDLFSEMDRAAKFHKVFTMDPEAIDAKTALRMATINGAKVLGLDRITGSLEKGKQADIIVIDLAKPHLEPMYNPYSHLVYSASGSDVKTSIINGKLVMNKRELLTMDIKTIMDDVKKLCHKMAETHAGERPFQLT